MSRITTLVYTWIILESCCYIYVQHNCYVDTSCLISSASIFKHELLVIYSVIKQCKYCCHLTDSSVWNRYGYWLMDSFKLCIIHSEWYSFLKILTVDQRFLFSWTISFSYYIIKYITTTRNVHIEQKSLL